MFQRAADDNSAAHFMSDKERIEAQGARKTRGWLQRSLQKLSRINKKEGIVMTDYRTILLCTGRALPSRAELELC